MEEREGREGGEESGTKRRGRGEREERLAGRKRKREGAHSREGLGRETFEKRCMTPWRPSCHQYVCSRPECS